METQPSFFRRKILAPLLEQLRQGASPDRLGWSVSLGLACGLFPILGTTTILCGIVGTALRLNHVAMQTANYLAYAPQLALIPVFIRLGEKISGATPLAIDLALMKARFTESPALFFHDFGAAAGHGVLAWLIVMPIPAWIGAKALGRIFGRMRGTSA